MTKRAQLACLDAGLGQAENRGDFTTREVLQVPQYENFPLARIELGEERLHSVLELAVL